MLEYEIVDQEVEHPIEHHVACTSYSVSECLTGKPLLEWDVQEIDTGNDDFGYLFE